MDGNAQEYVGFWARVGASLIDTVILLLIVVPLMLAVYGETYWTDTSMIKGPVGFVVEYLLPAVAVVAFWIARQATPGKMAIDAVIVDADTGAPATPARLVVRYLGYYVAMLPLMLGIVWVAFDRRKQGWHDKLARTVVVRRRRAPQAASATPGPDTPPPQA